jgi:hypothetical protein
MLFLKNPTWENKLKNKIELEKKNYTYIIFKNLHRSFLKWCSFVYQKKKTRKFYLFKKEKPISFEKKSTSM